MKLEQSFEVAARVAGCRDADRCEAAVTPVNGGTRVEGNNGCHITGRLARFARGGMIEDICEQLLREFAKRLPESLT